MTVKNIPLSSITVGDRYREDYGDIKELAENIKANGLISPIAVQDNGDGTYLLLAGGRRFQACTSLEMETIPARIYPSNLGKLAARTIEWAENIFRQALTWQEEVNLTQEIDRLQREVHGDKTQRLAGAPGWTQKSTANLLGKDVQQVNTDIKLARAIEEMPDLADCRNKSEALQTLARRKEEVIRAELARRIQVCAEEKKDLGKSALIDSYRVGDFFEHVKKLPNRAYNIVEIDPPYAVDLDAVRKASSGGSFNKSAPTSRSTTVSRYNEIPEKDYPDFMRSVLTSVYPKVSDVGWVIVWFGSSRWHDSVRTWIKEAGFTPALVPAVWTKPTMGAVIQPDYYLGSSYEGFFYAHKTPQGMINRKGRSNVFHYKNASHRGDHPTERPIELLVDILSTFGQAGDKVLVPFLGSGNTLLAAANLGMQGVGFELEQAHRDAFVVDVGKQTHGAYTSYKETP